MIVIVGPSASGKTTLMNALVRLSGMIPIVRYTSRNPRLNEVDGLDYRFLSGDQMVALIDNNTFVEFEQYSNGRYYGTSFDSLKNNPNGVCILTPNGLRAVKKAGIPVVSVYIDTPLAMRMIRYINRTPLSDFSYPEKDELCSRVERDFGMFLGIEHEVDYMLDGTLSLDVMVQYVGYINNNQRSKINE